jgi:hypothetical protein
MFNESFNFVMLNPSPNIKFLIQWLADSNSQSTAW